MSLLGERSRKPDSPSRGLFAGIADGMETRSMPLLCLALCVVSHLVAGEETWPDFEFRNAPEESRIFKRAGVNAMLRFAGEQNTRALLIVTDGRIELEHYFGSDDSSTRFQVASAAKSFTSALVGIAIAEGKLESADTPVSHWFPESKIRDATIADLLTMRSGLPYDRNLQVGMHRASSWLAYIGSQEPVREPGQRFQYSGFDPILLSAILTKATGRSLDDYADDKLFRPLGITSAEWLGDTQGLINGGSQLSLTARDLARFGWLYLRQGRWNDRQIVPEEWIHRSTTNQFEGGPWYGYYWWRLPAETESSDPRLEGCYFASGAGGQHILILPKMDLVVVRLGEEPLLKPSGQKFVPELLRRLLAVMPGDTRASSPLLLEDSFESELSEDWFWGLGAWMARDGILRGYESGPRRHGPVKLCRLAFNEADISYEFRLEGQASFSSFPINGNRKRGHILNVVMGRKEFRIIAHVRKGESIDLIREKITLDPDREWHPVRIVLKGETITAEFNGRTWTAEHPVVAETKENFGFGGDSGGPEGEKAGALEFRNLKIIRP